MANQSPRTFTPPPQPRRPRINQTLIWWCVLILAIGLWCAGNFGAGVSWRDTRLPVIPEGQTWSAAGVSLVSDAALHGTTITVPGDDPVRATAGAIFVAVALDYTLASTDLKQSCSMQLMGAGRTWTPSDADIGLTIGDVIPGVSADCSSTSPTGIPTLGGAVGAFFQIPAAALGEIQGVQVTVQDVFTWSDTQQASPVFANPSASAVFQITIQ